MSMTWMSVYYEVEGNQSSCHRYVEFVSFLSLALSYVSTCVVHIKMIFGYADCRKYACSGVRFLLFDLDALKLINCILDEHINRRENIPTTENNYTN